MYEFLSIWMFHLNLDIQIFEYLFNLDLWIQMYKYLDNFICIQISEYLDTFFTRIYILYISKKKIYKNTRCLYKKQ